MFTIVVEGFTFDFEQTYVGMQSFDKADVITFTASVTIKKYGQAMFGE